MKSKRIICLLMIILIAVQSSATGLAENNKDNQESSTWDSLMETFWKEHYVISDTVAVGYKNLVTGEEHYILPDTLMRAASIYKVPLNMYYTNKVYNGEIDWDMQVMGQDYKTVMQWSIINSNNEFSIALWKMIGNFNEYRDTMKPFIGEEGNEMEPLFYKENYYTPRQLIYCLTELYSNSEKYPGVLDCMKQAKPTQYFREHDYGVEIAQKYGYLDESIYVTNNMGIVYTDEPFALVVLTTNAYKAYQCIVSLCDLMVEYTNNQTCLKTIG